MLFNKTIELSLKFMENCSSFDLTKYVAFTRRAWM